MATPNQALTSLFKFALGFLARGRHEPQVEAEITQTPEITESSQSPAQSDLHKARLDGSGDSAQTDVSGQISEPSHQTKDISMTDKVKIIVDRYHSNSDATISRVYVKRPGQEPELVSYGVEDEKRAVKVYGETRIDAGTYDITLRTFGGFHKRHLKSRTLGPGHIGMLWIRNVPKFENILIHTGNSDDDTAGCLIVGAYADEKLMKVFLSRNNYRKLYDMVKADARDGNLCIEFQDNDGLTS